MAATSSETQNQGYEHFSQVSMRMFDLPVACEWHCTSCRKAVSYETAWVAESIKTPAPLLVAGDYAIDESQTRIYYDKISVARTDQATWIGEGSQYHFLHEMGDARCVIIDWNPPVHFISDEVAPWASRSDSPCVSCPMATAPASRSCTMRPEKATRKNWKPSSGKRPGMPHNAWQRSWGQPTLP